MRNEEFLEIGQHCSEASCRQLEFLPLACIACKLPFCGLHFRELAHDCPLYDAQRATNSLPVCPVCEKQITTSPFPDQPFLDPNLIIDHHLSKYCSLSSSLLAPSPSSLPSTTTQQKQRQAQRYVEERSKSMKECSATKCRTKLVVPIHCARNCGGTFCPRHREAGDHACPMPVRTEMISEGNKGKSGLGGKMQGLLKTTTPVSTQAGAKSKPKNPFLLDDLSSTLPTPASIPVESTKKKSALASIPANRKISKHASAERNSARKALELRAKKGLLSEREKLEYATLVALESKESNKTKGKDCCIS